jgi:hypothetical protein
MFDPPSLLMRLASNRRSLFFAAVSAHVRHRLVRRAALLCSCHILLSASCQSFVIFGSCLDLRGLNLSRFRRAVIVTQFLIRRNQGLTRSSNRVSYFNRTRNCFLAHSDQTALERPHRSALSTAMLATRSPEESSKSSFPPLRIAVSVTRTTFICVLRVSYAGPWYSVPRSILCGCDNLEYPNEPREVIAACWIDPHTDAHPLVAYRERRGR